MQSKNSPTCSYADLHAVLARIEARFKLNTRATTDSGTPTLHFPPAQEEDQHPDHYVSNVNTPSTFRLPSISLRASSSAIAVFPTPGSPGIELYQHPQTIFGINERTKEYGTVLLATGTASSRPYINNGKLTVWKAHLSGDAALYSAKRVILQNVIFQYIIPCKLKDGLTLFPSTIF
jgi:hypothetical protein